MARRVTRANNEYFENAGTVPQINGPFTVAFWWNPAFLDETLALWSLADDGSSNHFYNIFQGGDDNIIDFRIRTTFVSQATAPGGALSIGTWYHVMCTVDLDDDRFVCYLDNVAGSALATTKKPTAANFDRQRFGLHARSTEGQQAGGRWAEYGLWDLDFDLSAHAADRAALAAGVSPRFIQPANRLQYLSFIRGVTAAGTGNEVDPYTGDVWTAVNTPTTEAHPRIIYPSRQLQIGVPSAGFVPYPSPRGTKGGMIQMVGGAQ